MSSDQDLERDVERARELMAAAHKVVVLSGAGISAESGIPTFRGAGGLWREYRAQELATPEAFAKDPQLVWEFYEYRRQVVSGAEPNSGHRALASLAADKEVLIATQNIDRLHQAAGSEDVRELHGSLWVVRCRGCDREREDRTVPFPELPPRCAECGDLERPGVVWFGEALPTAPLQEAIQAAETCDLFLVVGTSAVVYPAAGIADFALARGRPVIEVNLDETGLSSRVTVALRGEAGTLLPQLL